MALLDATLPYWVQLLQQPEKAALFLTVVGGAIVGLVVKLATGLSQARREAAMAAVPREVAPRPLPESTPLPPPPELLQRLSKLEGAVAEWTLAECRAEVKQLQYALARATADDSAASQQIVALTYKLELAEKRATDLLRERDEMRAQLEEIRARLSAFATSDTDRPPAPPPKE